MRYSKSLIISVLIHTLLALTLFFSYKTISSYVHEQKNLCSCCRTTINLNSIKTSKPSPKVEEKVVKKEIKKVEKKIEEKILPKKAEEKQVAEPQITKEIAPVVEEVAKNEVKTTDSNISKVVEQIKKEDADTHCLSEVATTQEQPKVQESHEEKYLSNNINEIVALLQDNLYYPKRARRQGIEGVVTIKFTLSKSAKISNIMIVESEYEILSRAAITTIENLDGKLPAPKEELTLTVPIKYDLK